MLLADRWISLHPGMLNGIRGRLFAELDTRYREPHRRYHTWNHIQSCLRLFDRFRTLIRRPYLVELALWYHDAVYSPASPDNEIESGRLFRSHADALGMSPTDGNEVERLILSTRYGASRPSDREALLLRDIDLAVLGSSAEAYGRYASAIREEFSAMDPETFRSKRVAFLGELLSLRRIYSTREAAILFEEAAERNIRNEIERLSNDRLR